MPDGYFDRLPIPRKNVDLAGMQQNIASLQSGLAQEILDRESADATKANKSTTINGKSLAEDRVIYSQDVPSKNLLPNNIESQSSYYGVDITRNADGSLTFNGTASSTFAIVINYEVSLASGTYILSGCPSGGHTPTDGANDNYLIRGRFSTSSAWLTDIGDGIQFTGSNLKDISIRIASGYTCSNLTFRPMIRLASIEDDSYVPYAKSNVELTKEAINYHTVIKKTYSNTNVKASALIARRQGNVVYISSREDSKAMAAGTTTFVTLDAEFRPTENLTVPIANLNNGSYVNILTTGAVGIYRSAAVTAAANNCAFSAVYIVD